MSREIRKRIVKEEEGRGGGVKNGRKRKSDLKTLTKGKLGKNRI